MEKDRDKKSSFLKKLISNALNKKEIYKKTTSKAKGKRDSENKSNKTAEEIVENYFNNFNEKIKEN